MCCPFLFVVSMKLMSATATDENETVPSERERESDHIIITFYCLSLFISFPPSIYSLLFKWKPSSPQFWLCNEQQVIIDVTSVVTDELVWLVEKPPNVPFVYRWRYLNDNFFFAAFVWPVFCSIGRRVRAYCLFFFTLATRRVGPFQIFDSDFFSLSS